MKKILIIFSLLVLSASASKAQYFDPDSLLRTKKHEFLINPGSLFIGGFELGYGRRFKQGAENLRIYAGYYFSENAGLYSGNQSYPSNNLRYSEARNMESFRLEGQYRFYHPAFNHAEYYMGGYANFKSLSTEFYRLQNDLGAADNVWTKAKGNALGLGILFGFRAYVAGNFFMDLYLGGGINVPVGDNTYSKVLDVEIIYPMKKAILPKGGFSVGITF